jgi:Domain of unknown function (DUF4397)
MSRILRLTAAVAVIGTAATAGATTAHAAAPTGLVTVVHGLRGVVADVYVDNTLVLPAFEPERVTDPVAVPAGPHHVDIRVTGKPADAPPDVSADVDVQADARQSVVAHLNAAGAPTITEYVDDMSPVAAGETRAVVRHTAAAPAVDVGLDQTVVAAALTEPGSTTAVVPPATYQVSVWQAGTQSPLAAPQAATLSEGAATVMYLIGSAQANTLSWVAEQIPNLNTPPNKIQTGDSGLAADNGTSFPYVPVTLAVGVGGAAAIITADVTRRRRRSRAA